MVQSSGCVHYWIIESPRGPISRGCCKECGEEREFRNSIEGGYWDNYRSNGTLSQGLVVVTDRETDLD